MNMIICKIHEIVQWLNGEMVDGEMVKWKNKDMVHIYKSMEKCKDSPHRQFFTGQGRTM